LILGSTVPKVQPQPVLAPLTPAAVFLVATINDGGEWAVYDARPEVSGLGPRDRVPRPAETAFSARDRRRSCIAHARGGFRSKLGTDVAIGYLSHEAETVQLYLQETMTFRATPPKPR
jgi:Encapsulating protein for peroxidase